MTFLAALLGLFLAAYLTIGAVVVRRPLIGRFALREAARRPGQTAVVILGLMIAGASVISIQVVYGAVLLVTFFPALRAARLRPAEALRATG